MGWNLEPHGKVACPDHDTVPRPVRITIPPTPCASTPGPCCSLREACLRGHGGTRRNRTVRPTRREDPRFPQDFRPLPVVGARPGGSRPADGHHGVSRTNGPEGNSEKRSGKASPEPGCLCRNPEGLWESRSPRFCARSVRPTDDPEVRRLRAKRRRPPLPAVHSQSLPWSDSAGPCACKAGPSRG